MSPDVSSGKECRIPQRSRRKTVKKWLRLRERESVSWFENVFSILLEHSEWLPAKDILTRLEKSIELSEF